jgi:hypothetical protein
MAKKPLAVSEKRRRAILIVQVTVQICKPARSKDFERFRWLDFDGLPWHLRYRDFREGDSS